MLRPRLCSELFTAPGSLQMRGAARPGSYQNQWKGMAISKPKPRRNRSNTIAKANKTIPAETPIIPVTLITRPIMISLSAIADLLAPSYLITSSAGADHESRRSAVGASGTSDRKDSTPRWQETAALQDFNPAHDRYGSKAAEMIGRCSGRCLLCPRKRTNSRSSRHVRLVPKTAKWTEANNIVGCRAGLKTVHQLELGRCQSKLRGAARAFEDAIDDAFALHWTDPSRSSLRNSSSHIDVQGEAYVAQTTSPPRGDCRARCVPLAPADSFVCAGAHGSRFTRPYHARPPCREGFATKR